MSTTPTPTILQPVAQPERNTSRQSFSLDQYQAVIGTVPSTPMSIEQILATAVKLPDGVTDDLINSITIQISRPARRVLVTVISDKPAPAPAPAP